MRLRFITSTPLDIRRGSGTFVAISSLKRALEQQGIGIELTAPRVHLPVYTLERILFNQTLGWKRAGSFDANIGFDLDGYRLAGRGVPHVASLKGVIADEVRFQSGMTRATMALQARYEARHVRRADLVLTTSAYAAARAGEFYGVQAHIVPELIDLRGWRRLLEDAPDRRDPRQFRVLCVCRLYWRKRVNVLLEAAALLAGRIPELAVRIVGDGPQAGELRRLWRQRKLERVAEFVGDVSLEELAAEYQACDVFCLPSVQEGFGIVYLEAMGAGKPIIAARAAATPEVVRHGLLVEADHPEELAAALERLYRNPQERAALGAAGAGWVEQFDAPRVAARFLQELESVGVRR